MSTGSLSVGLALLAGIVTVLSPCILPVLPIVVGRSLQSHRYGPVAMVAGLIGGFAVAGSLIGFAASWIADLSNILRSIAIAILLAMGLLSIFPSVSYRVFRYLSVNFNQQLPIGLGGEFFLGSQLGLLWTPCAGPVLGSILVLAAVQHQPLQSLGLLLVYGLGAGIPLLLLAYGGRYVSHRLLQLRSHSHTIQRIGGIMIAGTAIAMLLGVDVWLQLQLAPLFPALSI